MPCGSIWKIDEIVGHPQLEHRDVLQTIDSRYGPMRLVGAGFRLEHGSPGIDREPPTLGEHTDEILARGRLHGRRRSSGSGATRWCDGSRVRLPVTDGVVKTDRHTTFYLDAGAADAPVIVFVHGWPELSLSWRHQLPCFADLGFRAIAPDMRGYGRSSVYARHEDYALEHAVRDMLELLDALGREKAVWVGHDWGSPVVWSMASHHPERCWGVANLCVPYLAAGLHPAQPDPAGRSRGLSGGAVPGRAVGLQLFYEESFEKACAAFDADPRNMVKALFRKGEPERQGQAVAHRAGPQGRRLVRRHRPGARRADGRRRGDRGGARHVRGRRSRATASSARTPGT